MTVGDGGCRPGTAKTPSSADNGRPAVIHMLGRDGRSWRRPVRPGKISDGTAVPGRRTGRLTTLIASNYQRASPSRLYLASWEPAGPDRIQPTRLDCFQQVESQPTQIVSSQLRLLTNSCCESHTQPKRHGSLIMTEKDHLPTNEHSVICHSKMVRTTINQWECFEPTNHLYIL